MYFIFIMIIIDIFKYTSQILFELILAKNEFTVFNDAMMDLWYG